jgi:hypothetical protein
VTDCFGHLLPLRVLYVPLGGGHFVGTAGNDVIIGTPQWDDIHGERGTDRIYGDDGNDYVGGESGEDALMCGNFANTGDPGDIADGGTGMPGSLPEDDLVNAPADCPVITNVP